MKTKMKKKVEGGQSLLAPRGIEIDKLVPEANPK